MSNTPRKRVANKPQDHLTPIGSVPKPPDDNEPTADEIALAAAQENESFQAEQMSYLQNRVAVLRIQVNRLQNEISQLKGEQQ